ncbi:hypothetical protein LWI29_023944 [Acer saccharum]|uniref:DUF4219 domain-containing protein n=1 Tax=Acer saccharum TaxID=4024 RepID=A0AA39VLJ8_ACESA|nr:hypothetical protein LWI29_023944 [Acer saccharum]
MGDSMPEGASSGRPPLLNSGNYSFWKIRMRAYIRSINEKAWISVEEGYELPTKRIEDGTMIAKPRAEWTAIDFDNAKWHHRAMNAIFGGVDCTQFIYIQNLESAKEAWDTLQTTNEGTLAVRRSRVQMLTSQFESLVMNEDEKLVDFQTRLLNITNQSQTLGELYPQERINWKILRSLPKRFNAKVTAIEESKNVDLMRVDELLGSLQTYELGFKPKIEGKGIALKVTNEESEDDVACMVRTFKKFLKNICSKREEVKKKITPKEVVDCKDKSMKKLIQCHECKGIGFISTKRANEKRESKKGLAMAASWSDVSVSDKEEEEESSNEREYTSNYIAHPAIYEGRFEDNSEDSSSIEESENSSSSEDSEISSNDEEFEVSSNQDFISFNDKILQQKNEENIKLKLINANLVVIFKALINEKKMSLEKMSKQSEVIKEHEKTIEKNVSKVEESAQELDYLREDFTMKLFAMEGEIKQKENSLSIMKIKECELKDEVKSLKESINGMKIGAIKLDEVIKLGKHHGDMSGLGFVEEVKKTPTTKNKSRKSKKKKDSTTIPSNIKDKDKKSNGTSQPTFQPKHAHPKGHIKPKCYKYIRQCELGNEMHASEMKRLPLVVSKHVRALETMHDEHVNEKKSTRKVWVKKNNVHTCEMDKSSLKVSKHDNSFDALRNVHIDHIHVKKPTKKIWIEKNDMHVNNNHVKKYVEKKLVKKSVNHDHLKSLDEIFVRGKNDDFNMSDIFMKKIVDDLSSRFHIAMHNDHDVVFVGSPKTNMVKGECSHT